tara:strand:- start:76 stop:705 length:630 start_codon:yes stop_codon:yes gene_type:complete
MLSKLSKIVVSILNYFKYNLIRTYFLKNLHFKSKIDLVYINQELKKYKINPKKLKYTDFLKGEKKEFTSQKLKIIESRLNSQNYIALGEIKNNILAYSTWISLKETKIPIINKTYLIPKDHAFLEDSYCHSNYRGLGLHKGYNLYRIKKIMEIGRIFVNVFVFSNNIPAIKVQKSSGLTVKDIFIVGRLFGFNYHLQSSSIFYKILNLI